MDEINEHLTFQNYFYEVARQAAGLGYTPYMIEIFKSDIRECYDNGLTIEQTLEEVF